MYRDFQNAKAKTCASLAIQASCLTNFARWASSNLGPLHAYSVAAHRTVVTKDLHAWFGKIWYVSATDAGIMCKKHFHLLISCRRALIGLYRYFKSKPRPPKGFDENKWKRVLKFVVASLPHHTSPNTPSEGWYKPIIYSLREILPTLSKEEQHDHIQQLMTRRWEAKQWVRVS